MKSTHKAEVVRIHLEKHPNADALSVVKVFGGYTVCCRTADWTEGQLAVYIVPDTIVDTTRPEFAFLASECKQGEVKYKVQAKKLRQVPSFGMLIPAPEGAVEGDNLFEQLGLEHYEPPTPASTGGDDEKGPEHFIPKYDVDTLKRYVDKFVPGEDVYVTEKIHGASARYTWHDGRMYVGSKEAWKKQDPKSAWWKALIAEENIGIQVFCMANPDLVLYGEIYGAVQDLKYGAKPGEVKFAAFDIWHKGENRWLGFDEFTAKCIFYDVPMVPSLGGHTFDLERLLSLAEGPSLVPGANHIREGICVRPMVERTDLEIGRVHLKIVGLGYLSRKQK